MILTSVVDAWANEAKPGINYGPVARLWVNGGAGGNDRQTYIWFPNKVPANAKVLSAVLRLRLYGAWASTNNITIQRITTKWAESTLRWNNRPTTTTTNQEAVAIVSGVDKQLIEIDVMDMMQDVANGGAFHGFRITLTQDVSRSFRSGEDANVAYRPTLEIEWSEAPDPPDRLSPDGGQVVSDDSPLLDWRFTDKVGTGTGSLQSSSQVQVSSTNDFVGDIDYDSGKIANAESQHDLGANLLTKNQSDIETNTTGLQAISNAAIARVTSQFFEGVASLQITASGAGNVDAGQNSANRSTVVEGRTYSASAYIRPNSTTRNIRICIDWYNAGGSIISTTVGADVAEVAATWVRASVTGVAPALAVTARMFVRVMSAAGGEIHFADALQLEQADAATAWRPAWTVSLLPDAGILYWRVRVWDGTDNASEWSESADFRRDDPGSLTINAPGATVPETTPPVLWTLTGETQEKFRVTLFRIETDTTLTQLWQASELGASNTITIPSGFLVTGSTYRVMVEVWDNEPRVGDEHLTKTQDFTYVRDGTPNAVTALTAVAVQGAPAVTLTWTRSVTPDYFALKVGGVEVTDRIEPGDVFVSGTTYSMTYWLAKPRTTLTFEVEAVTQSGAGNPYLHSDGNATATAKTDPVGMWLVDPADNVAVNIVGKESADFAIGESAVTHYVRGSKVPVRITDVVRGYEGPIKGQVLGATERDDFLELKSRRKVLYLIVGNLSIPIRMEDASCTPTSVPNDQVFSVGFNFFQAGAPWPVR